ncbi:MAG: flavodoxin [Negativicutes bacterium]|nr:flavodoxin [Negativicutes bacterium]
MKKVAVVFWSGTGNTEIMAKEIASGVQEAGAEVKVFASKDFTVDMVDGYDKIAFGCPSMGMEQLEDYEFEPMFAAVEGSLAGKEVALFGSYGWGDGAWMRDWHARCLAVGAKVFGDEGLLINGTPDQEGINHCRTFGKSFAI